ncbi:MAG: nucleotidyltransferase domain-containing protein [Sandaracinaceae bacterium]
MFETLHGSRAYGLAREGSDTDLKGVVVGPPRWYFGFGEAPEQIELSADHVRYELRKLMRLAAANNPSILEVLFAHEDDHRVVTRHGARLLALRDRLLSRRCADTFGGYALSQLGRIRRHRRWLLEPPSGPPRREDFGLGDAPTLPRAELGAADALVERGTVELSESFLAILDRERRFRGAKKEWDQFRAWQRERNPARAALEAAHGYDTKHAMHLVRLSRMAVEILEEGEVRVRRDDRDELLAIRDGRWSYDELLEQAERLRARIAEAKPRSLLPEAPDDEALDAACAAIVEEVLACR